MLQVALRGSAARATLWRSSCIPSLSFKPFSIRTGNTATIHTSALANLAGNLRQSCRQAPIRITFSAQWTTTRGLQTRFFSSNNAHMVEDVLPVLPPRSVGSWLMVSSTLVFAIIVVGGVTRLTESGLSITEWKPVTGVLPPLTHEEWLVEFDKYKGTPEFKMYVSSYCKESHCTQ
jgi:heme a synthase